MDKSEKKVMPEGATLLWQVSGGNWTFQRRAGANICPIELATLGVESVARSVAEGENWKNDLGSTGCSLETDDDEYPWVGFVLLVENNAMQNSDEHIVVRSSVVLANAGHHSEARRLEEAWAMLSEPEQLNLLLRDLGWS
jgi:hypothetical protein